MENQKYTEAEAYELVVIGSGPGGYVAAIKAAQMGKKTAIVECREIGGTCLNRGCIPTKTLMHSAHLYEEAKRFQEFGITIDSVGLDLEKVWERKTAVVDRMRKGILSLLEANHVTVIYGKARILERSEENKRIRLGITIPDTKENSELLSEQELMAEKVLIATGSKPSLPKLEGIELPGVITSDELLERKELYPRLLIIGGGVIGIEFASLYQGLGCQVEILEAMDRTLPNMDKEISQSIAMSLKKKGVTIHTKALVNRISKESDGSLSCVYSEKEQEKTAFADGILVSIGRKAYTEELFDKDFMVEMEGAYLKVKDNFETSIPGVYAIGDVIRGQALAHVASAQGIAAVEDMFGHSISVNLKAIPSCVYTSPEIAVVGLSEEKAIEAGKQVKTGKYPMLGNGKTILSAGERGFIKLISDAETDHLLGAVLLCDRATDMVSELTAAIVNGLTVKEMTAVVRPHPTYSEAITEALEDIEDRAIHITPPIHNAPST